MKGDRILCPFCAQGIKLLEFEAEPIPWTDRQREEAEDEEGRAVCYVCKRKKRGVTLYRVTYHPAGSPWVFRRGV